MKGRYYCLMLLFLLPTPALAAQLPQEVQDALPPAAEELLTELGDEAVSATTLTEGLSLLWERVCAWAGDVLRQSVSGGVLLLGVVLLCALTEACMPDDREKRRLVPMAGALAITLIALGNVKSMMGLGLETVEELNVFSKALLPTLSAAVAAGGGVVSASVRQVATVFFADLLLSLIHGLLLPLVYVYVAAASADAMLPGQRLGALARAIRKGITLLLTGALALFTLYLSLSGAVASSADGLTLRLTQGAVGALPVVGSILSDVAASVLAGAGAVKNTVGVLGLLAVLALCLLPLLRLGAQYLLYKLSAFLAGLLGSGALTELIDNLGGAFGLIFGMTGACGLLLLISIASAMGVVSG